MNVWEYEITCTGNNGFLGYPVLASKRTDAPFMLLVDWRSLAAPRPVVFLWNPGMGTYNYLSAVPKFPNKPNYPYGYPVEPDH